jgi:olfactory receptor
LSGTTGNLLSLLHLCVSFSHNQDFYFNLPYLQCHQSCDSLLPLLFLFCSWIWIDKSDLAVFYLISSLLIIFISYLFIFAAIIGMNLTEDVYKAFSNKRSNLNLVIVFYGTLIFIYLKHKSSHPFDTDKVTFRLYMLFFHMLKCPMKM